MLRETITRFLEENHIPPTSGFIIAVSGGADSISLLHAFKYLNLKILALHCNFGLRGKESDMDEQFVKRFCETYGIALSIKKFDTTAYAAENGISIEMAARDLRYAWFREMKTKRKMDYIVTGHHADDLAETVLINQCRGTGIRGLSGIRQVSADLLRPLLPHSKDEILAYINKNLLGYRTDSTNESTDFVRNRIRHQVIPVFKQINPAFLSVIAENCENMRETAEIFYYGIQQLQEQIMESEGDEILIDIRKTMESPAPFTLLYETLLPFGFNKTQIHDILCTHDATPGKQFSAGSHMLTRGRTYWRIHDTRLHTTTDVTIPAEGEYAINGRTYRFTILTLSPDFIIPKDATIACLDAGKIRFPLTVRNWQAGDYFCPLGMKKSKKKLSDFFTDLKFSARQKQECLLLLSGSEIAWVIGHRPDERFKVGPLTHSILMAEALQPTP